MREKVTLLMCAADAFLMTSIAEGSPQVIKEAMACGCPIVSADVGDVKEVVDGVDGCYIVQHNKLSLLCGLTKAIVFGKTSGRDRIIQTGFDNIIVSQRLIDIYSSLI